MKKKKLLFMLIATAIAILAGCTKDEEKDETEKENKEVSINPDYVSIDWNEATVLSEDSTGTFQIQFSGEMPTIHAGSIITIDRGMVVHHRFVNSVSVSGNTMNISSSEAFLTDIFSNSEFTLTTSPSKKSMAKGAVYYPVEAYVIDEQGSYMPLELRKPRKGPLVGITDTMWHYTFDNDDFELASGNNYRLQMEKMNLFMGLNLEMTLNFGGSSKRALAGDAIERYRSNALSVSAAVVGTFSTEQKIRCDIHGETRYNPEPKMLKRDMVRPIPIRFVVYGVPIIITLRADLYGQVELSASGEISAYTGFSDEAESRLGFVWHQSGGMTPVTQFSNTFEFTSPTIEGQGSLQAKVWVFPRVRMMLYDIIGPSFDFKPYLADTVRGGFREQLLGQSNDYCAWSLDAHTGMDVSCGLSLKFLGYEHFTDSMPMLNIKDYKLYHSPNSITHETGSHNVGERQTVTFNVYDYNYLFHSEVATPLPQIVKFEADGELSSEYGIVRDGKVSVTWKPVDGDILYAKLYDVNGEILAFDTMQTSLNDEANCLMRFFNTANGNNWYNNTNWGTSAPLSDWYGVTTDDNGHVTSINLDNNNLKGSYFEINLSCLDKLTSINLNNNELRDFSIQHTDRQADITLNNCVMERAEVTGFKNVTIDGYKTAISRIESDCQKLIVSNCNFGDEFCPFSGAHADSTIIDNCTMHSCGSNSPYLHFRNNSRTYDTWYCNTSQKLIISNSYCSTICGWDFNDNTIIILQNATLWRSNWNEESLVTLTTTITGSRWDGLFD